MTAIEQWFQDVARAAAKSDEEMERPTPTTVEQRIAVVLAQARAAECRHQAGEIALRIGLNQPFFRMYHSQLIERSHRFEQYALQMAAQYPPVDEPKEQQIEMEPSRLVKP
jgi:hypothetical protein